MVEREAVRPADERPAAARDEHLQVGVDLGDRADGAAAASSEALLVDHDAGGDVPDGIARRPGELRRPAGVRAARLDELALRLRADDVEHEHDLPLPLTPVKATSRYFGTSTSMPLRLCVRTPRISMLDACGLLVEPASPTSPRLPCGK